MKEKVLKVVPVAAIVSAALPLTVFAEESAVQGALTSAFTGVASSIQGTITSLLPIGLGVVGTVLAIKFGIRFFRTIVGNK